MTASLLAALMATGASCGGSSDSQVTDPLNSSNLTAAEAAAVAQQFASAASAISSAQTSGSVSALEARRSGASTVTSTPSGVVACPVSGRMSYSGNITSSANTTSWSVYGGVTFQYSDPTNNLNDCAVTDDVILDGTLDFILAGDSTSGIGWTLNGSIEIDQRGPTGGLSPRGSCFVSLNMPKGGTKATGSVCGQPIS